MPENEHAQKTAAERAAALRQALEEAERDAERERAEAEAEARRRAEKAARKAARAARRAEKWKAAEVPEETEGPGRAEGSSLRRTEGSGETEVEDKGGCYRCVKRREECVWPK
jgi:NADH dehydrogenase [ubiquinone] 1 alpha subcomplex assembly factor 7